MAKCHCTAAHMTSHLTGRCGIFADWTVGGVYMDVPGHHISIPQVQKFIMKPIGFSDSLPMITQHKDSGNPKDLSMISAAGLPMVVT